MNKADNSGMPTPTGGQTPESAEKAASRYSELRTRAILNSVSSGIVTVDEFGAIDSFNPAATKIFGYAEPEVLGQHVRLILPALAQRWQDTAPVIGSSAPAIPIQEGLLEAIGIRKNNLVFPASLNLSWIQVAGHRLLTCVVDDLSAQRLIEEKILHVSTQEQQRIGQDLHDGLGQELTGIAFLCQTLSQVLREKLPDQAAAAERIVTLIGQAIEHTRAIVRGLCPIKLGTDGLGLHQSLLELTGSTETLFNVQCRLVNEPPIQVHHLTTATHIYYITREAIHNALKHARARSIEVRLETQDDWVQLTVRADGHPGYPDSSSHASEGRGISIMESRVRMIRGLMNFSDLGDQGSLLTVSFPLPSNRSPGDEAADAGAEP